MLRARRVAALAGVALAATTVAGCGGSSQASCTIYDRSANLSIEVRAHHTQQQVRDICVSASRRLSSATGAFWSLFKGPASYSGNTIICTVRKDVSNFGEVELDINGTPNSSTGNVICASYIKQGWTQTG